MAFQSQLRTPTHLFNGKVTVLRAVAGLDAGRSATVRYVEAGEVACRLQTENGGESVTTGSEREMRRARLFCGPAEAITAADRLRDATGAVWRVVSAENDELDILKTVVLELPT